MKSLFWLLNELPLFSYIDVMKVCAGSEQAQDPISDERPIRW